jgi:hypothetical protein
LKALQRFLIYFSLGQEHHRRVLRPIGKRAHHCAMSAIAILPKKKNYEELSAEIEELKRTRQELLYALELCKARGEDETQLRQNIWTNNFLAMKADVSRNWQ